MALVMIMSGWSHGKWYGCGTEEELEAAAEYHRDEAAVYDQPGPGELKLTPATKKEVEQFRAESGDDWNPLLVVQNGHYYKQE